LKLLFYAMAAIVFALGTWLATRRAVDLADGVHTTGTVVAIERLTDRCREHLSRRRRGTIACTKFRARIEYVAAGRAQSYEIAAGESRRFPAPIRDADYRMGEEVELVHAPRGTPVYLDTPASIIGAPLVFFLVAFISAFAGWRLGRD
jgi:hypothetical protein